MKLYTVYDSVAQEHSSVFECKNNDVAMRLFRQNIAKYPDPESMRLFCVGYVDRHDEQFKITPLEEIQVVDIGEALPEGKTKNQEAKAL